MIKLLILALVLFLPLIVNLLEQKKRREKAQRAMRKVRGRQGQAPETPKPQQSLADWIEEVRQKQEVDASGQQPPRRAAPDPLDDPSVDRQFEEVFFGDEEDVEFVEALPPQPGEAPFVEPVPERPEPSRQERSSSSGNRDQARRARGARRVASAGLRDGRAKLTPEDLREAIILREILDRPLSLRPRRTR